jgi:hypothetical protein
MLKMNEIMKSLFFYLRRSGTDMEIEVAERSNTAGASLLL